MVLARALVFVAGLVVLAPPALAQRRGSGVGWTGGDAMAETGNASSAHAIGREEEITPRHGLLAAPGAAPDAYGPTRLGTAAPASAGEAGTTAPAGWRAGDRVRSATSSDVRQARVQQASEIEVRDASGAARAGGATKAAPATQRDASRGGGR